MPQEYIPIDPSRLGEFQRPPFSEFIYGFPAGYYGAKKLAGLAGMTIQDLTGWDLPGDPEAVARNAAAKYLSYAPTRTDPAAQFYRGGLSEGLTQSTLAGIPGMVAGFSVGGPIGAGLGFAVGAGNVFGLAEYQQFMDDYEVSLQSMGITDPEVVKNLRKDPEIVKAAITSALVEGGMEAFTDLLQLKIFKLAGKSLTEPIKKGATEAAKRLLLGYVKTAPVEVGTEAIQAATEIKIRQDVGIDTGITPLEAAKQVVLPALGQTLGRGVGAELAGRFLKPVAKPETLPGLKEGDVTTPKEEKPFAVGNIIIQEGYEDEDLEILDTSDPAQFQAKRLKDGAVFPVGAKTIRHKEDALIMTRELLRMRMMRHPKVTSEQVDGVLLLYDAFAYTHGITTDELLKNMYDWSYKFDPKDFKEIGIALAQGEPDDVISMIKQELDVSDAEDRWLYPSTRGDIEIGKPTFHGSPSPLEGGKFSPDKILTHFTGKSYNQEEVWGVYHTDNLGQSLFYSNLSTTKEPVQENYIYKLKVSKGRYVNSDDKLSRADESKIKEMYPDFNKPGRLLSWGEAYPHIGFVAGSNKEASLFLDSIGIHGIYRSMPINKKNIEIVTFNPDRIEVSKSVKLRLSELVKTSPLILHQKEPIWISKLYQFILGGLIPKDKYNPNFVAMELQKRMKEDAYNEDTSLKNEVAFYGLDDWLASKALKGEDVTKQELFQWHLDHAIQLVEVKRELPKFLQNVSALSFDGALYESGMFSEDPSIIAGPGKYAEKIDKTFGGIKQEQPELHAGFNIPGEVEASGEIILYLPVLKSTDTIPSGHMEGLNLSEAAPNSREDLKNFRDIGWFRYTVRKDADGKSIFFIEEVQSDWYKWAHQTGMKGVNMKKWKKLRAVVDEARKLHESAMRDFGAFKLKIHETADETANTQENYTEHLALVDALTTARHNLRKAEADLLKAIPEALQWHEAIIRRAVKFAADHGFERIGLATGEQVNKLWGGYQPTDVFKIGNDFVPAYTGKKMSGDFKEPNYKGMEGATTTKVTWTVKREFLEDVKDGYLVSSPTDNGLPDAWNQKGKVIGLETVTTKVDGGDVLGYMEPIYSDFVPSKIEVEGAIITGISKAAQPWAFDYYDKTLQNYLGKIGRKFGVEAGEGRLITSRSPVEKIESAGYTIERSHNENTGLYIMSIRDKSGTLVSDSYSASPTYGFESFINEFASNLPDPGTSIHSMPIVPEMTSPVSLFQLNDSIKGLTQIMDNGRAFVNIFGSADVSTFIHESWHFFEQNLTPEEWKLHRKYFGASIEGREASARAFERFLREGRTKNQALNNIFTKFKEWLTEIYKRIKGSPIDIKLTPEIRAFFDGLLFREGMENGTPLPLTLVNESKVIAAGNEAEAAVKANPKTGFAKALEKLQKAFDTVAHWTAIGAPEVGEAIKVAPTREEYEMIYSEVVINKLRNMVDGDDKLFTMAALVHEKEDIWLNRVDEASREKVKACAEEYGKYFEDRLRTLQARGILQEGFVQNLLVDLQEKMASALESRNMEEADQIEKDIEFVKGLEYQPILLSWFENKVHKDPAGARSVMRYSTRTRRYIRSVTDMLTMVDENTGKPLLKLEDFHPSDVITTYARRYGRDISMNEVIVAAERSKNKMATKIGDPTSESGKSYRQKLIDTGRWVDPPTRAVVLRGYMVKPELRDWLEQNLYLSRPQNMFERALAYAKGAQFVNPFRMAGNNIVQMLMLSGPSFLKDCKYMKKAHAARRAFFRGEEGGLVNEYKAYHWNGGPSKPIGSPGYTFDDQLEKMRKSTFGKQILSTFTSKAFGKRIPNPLKGAYNISWNLAWGYGDELLRLASYLRLRDEGMTQRQAAQESAMFYGDYAAVPVKTRRLLNKIFFTPTYKLVMGKLYGRLLRGTADATFMRENPLPQHYAMGLIYTTGVVMAVDMMMTMLGYEPDEWGRRYRRVVDTDQGPKEIAISFTSPANMFAKYYYAIRQGILDEPERPLWKLALTMKWDLHPVWRLIMEIGENKDMGGKDIHDTFDPFPLKALKDMRHFVFGTIQMLQLPDNVMNSIDVNPEMEGDITAHHLFVDDMGKRLFNREAAAGMSALMSLYSFKYVRGTEEQRQSYRVRKLMSEYRRIARAGKMTEEKNKKFMQYIDDAIARY